jgi:beta-glucanase (GH16 family)
MPEMSAKPQPSSAVTWLLVAALLSAMIGLYHLRVRFILARSPIQPSWRLTFADEFDTHAIDSRNWSTCYHFGERVDGVLKCVMDWDKNPVVVHQPDQVTVENGVARLGMDRKTVEAFGQRFEYASGMLSSHKSFSQQYGYFEIRAKVAKGSGLWFAFWLMPSSLQWPPEIDVVEVLGRDVWTAHGTLHYRGATVLDQSDGNSVWLPELSSGFHIFSAKWAPNEIVWYLDNVEYHRVTQNIPREPMYILVTHGAGPSNSWGGPIGSDTLFPNAAEIDYVRVFQIPENN